MIRIISLSLVKITEKINFTHQFESYRQKEKFRAHACRGYDPESKGKIENVIGFIKKNFAKHRVFTTLEDWNDCQGGLNDGETGKNITPRKKDPSLFSKKKNSFYDRSMILFWQQPLIRIRYFLLHLVYQGPCARTILCCTFLIAILFL